MTENLRVVLLIIGVIAIAALLIHGIWSSRKERSSFFSDRNAERQKKRKNNSDNRSDIDENFDANDLDIDDVGEVKVVSQSAYLPQTDNDVNLTNRDFGSKDFTNRDSIAGNNDSFADNVLSDSIDKSINTKDVSSNATSLSSDSFASNKEMSTATPRVNEQSNQQITQLNTSENVEQELAEADSLNSANVDSAKNNGSISGDDSSRYEEHVILFHVVGLNGGYLRGDLLLNSFLNAGLHYGDMNIFHKHIGTANTPVLFSIANMVNPGTFDPVRMSEFSTPGVTCFMVLPTAGQPIQNFKIMLQTIQRIADDVGGVVWDNERRLITPQKIDQYRAEIRAWMERNPKIT